MDVLYVVISFGSGVGDVVVGFDDDGIALMMVLDMDMVVLVWQMIGYGTMIVLIGVGNDWL